MAAGDQERWDRKYGEDPTLLRRVEAADVVKRWYRHAPEGRAIDLACGGGRNALFLARCGFEVDALDISSVAIEDLKRRVGSLPVRPILTDLDCFSPENGRYALALMINYLDRALIGRTVDALIPGGLFLIETYMDHPENEKRGNPAFLLLPRELPELLGNRGEILEYREFWNEGERYRMRKQSIAFRKKVGEIDANSLSRPLVGGGQ